MEGLIMAEFLHKNKKIQMGFLVVYLFTNKWKPFNTELIKSYLTAAGKGMCLQKTYLLKLLALQQEQLLESWGHREYHQ